MGLVVIIEIILDPWEGQHLADVTSLMYPPACVLVELNLISGTAIGDLEEGVVPIFPSEQSFQILVPNGKTGNVKTKTVKQCNLPLTESYALMDYWSQGQTIPYVIVDIGAVPYGKLTPFNVYVALSWSSGQETIHLLQDFEDSLFTTTPCEALEEEDKRLIKLDRETKKIWEKERRQE